MTRSQRAAEGLITGISKAGWRLQFRLIMILLPLLILVIIIIIFLRPILDIIA